MEGRLVWPSPSGKSRGAARIGARLCKTFLTLAACMALLNNVVVLACWTSSVGADAPASAGNTAGRLDSGNQASPASRPGNNFGEIPVTFEENQGQAGSPVKFIARTPSHSVFILANETIITVRGDKPTSSPAVKSLGAQVGTRGQLKGHVAAAQALDNSKENSTLATVDMKLAGAARNSRIEGLDRTQGKVNYFLGQDQAKWRTGIPTYATVKESGVYPGIDLIYHRAESNPGQLEYDFVVAPGANPKAINLSFEGASGLRLDAGDLVLETKAGEVRQKAPTAYQEIGGVRTAIASKYEIKGRGRRAVSFQVGNYDGRYPLVIDPTLVYSTYFGNGTVRIRGIGTDAMGNTYLGGYGDLPATSGAYNAVGPNAGSPIPFITELNPAGQVVYTSAFAGSGSDFLNTIAVDAQGNVYASGLTESKDFPVTAGAFQTKLKSSNGNAFVLKLLAVGSELGYSTYLGGSHNDTTPPISTNQGQDGTVAIAVGGSGNAYVVGVAGNVDFPTTPNAFEPTATIMVADETAFATELSADGKSLVYSTFLESETGPTNIFGGGGLFQANAAGVDGSGDLFVAATVSGGFPTTKGVFQPNQYGTSAASAIVLELNPAGQNLVFATYLGDATTCSTITCAPDGGVWVGGTVNGAAGDFPTVNPLDAQPPNVVMKSTDGGATFTKEDSGISSAGISPVSNPAIAPSNTSTVYVLGTVPNGQYYEPALYSSTDGGGS
ncbi:MAG TPA: hypothetical protein VI756_09995, partial [Blastocatellia bacterium]